MRLAECADLQELHVFHASLLLQLSGCSHGQVFLLVYKPTWQSMRVCEWRMLPGDEEYIRSVGLQRPHYYVHGDCRPWPLVAVLL